MHIVRTFGHLVGGTLLVSGTSIGVGMLALPVATAAGGFFPALSVYILCWLFMLCTGLLILEACIWMPKEANLITLTSRLLGKWGKVSCWILYLFLFSCLMVAHITGGGDVVKQLSQDTLSSWLSTFLYVIVFAPIVYLGTLWVDRFNLILMSGVVITYLLFVSSSISHVNTELLLRADWNKVWLALPVVFTAFGYQSLIPTLYNFMKGKYRQRGTRCHHFRHFYSLIDLCHMGIPDPGHHPLRRSRRPSRSSDHRSLCSEPPRRLHS